MNVGEMVDRVAADQKITKVAAREQIDYYFGENGLIAQQIKGGNDVKLGDLGSLKRVHRAARKGRNPQTKAEILIPAKNTVGFKPSSAFVGSL